MSGLLSQINPDLITDDMMYEQVFDSRTSNDRPLIEQVKEDQLWGEIRRAAKTNKTLQDVLERAIIIYQLSKDNGTK
jgi:hypothetical protein